MYEIAKRLKEITTKIKTTCNSHSRDERTVTLIAVSKGHDTHAVATLYGTGQKIFGENRVQEADKKFAALRKQHPDIELHLIGALQTNKCDDAVALFDVIHTLDRTKLAEALAKSINKLGRSPQLFVEINMGNEPQKAGIAPELLGDFLDYCRTTCGLSVDGLMCIPPHHEDPMTPFRALAQLAEKYNLKNLSMGMSADFEQAIACGATHVRIGTAIFGQRDVQDRKD